MVREGLREGAGEDEESGEGDSEGDGEDFGLERRDGFSDAVGDGEASCKGLTGPVGLSGGAGLAAAVGEGEGDGAATRIAPPRHNSSATMNRRDLMDWWIGRSAGDASNGASPPLLGIEQGLRAHLRRRFARCQKFPHERSSSSLGEGFFL